MNQAIIQKLHFSNAGEYESFSFPLSLIDSLQLISDFYRNNSSNKLCLVFPSKELAAQWIYVSSVLFEIKNDFTQFKVEIFESYQKYCIGDKLKLNGDAIVKWAGISNNSVAFKAGKEPNTATFTLDVAQSIKLQRAEQSRQMSSLNKVKSALPGKIITPLDKLLDINTYGNREFIKNKICLITKYKSFNDLCANIELNHASISEYFPIGKIDENGMSDNSSPFLLSKNLSNLSLYLVANSINKIIIDGFSAIQERGTDFSDIDSKNIPTILITDLSEIESFECINNFGFEFFNFTKEILKLNTQSNNSPFHIFNQKSKKFIDFKLQKEICLNSDLETITQKIHSIEKDDTNNDLNTLLVYLIQLTNLVSRICHIPSHNEIDSLNNKLCTIHNLFLRSKIWLGDSQKPIEESISILKSVIETFALKPSEKSVRLKHLLSQDTYDYIICPTSDEALALKTSFSKFIKTKVISVSDVNDKLLTDKPVKAIITGWAKSNNINRILSSFLFSEITVLFYQFENRYYNSLLRRNRKSNNNIKSTISPKGIRLTGSSEKMNGFDNLYIDEQLAFSNNENAFDILDFELKLDDALYSKYTAKGNLIESIKSKRIDFENDMFIYSSESHKFLVINSLYENCRDKANIYRKKIDALKPGDVIVMINTERDILAELVENNTNRPDLTAIKQWTDLWKNLLKEYFASNGNDFRKLMEELRKSGCKKHEVTIRLWLQDENRIGPEDDEDLISIAIMTNSQLLYDNISKVRQSISKMTGWRMQASDIISNKIKGKIHEIIDSSKVQERVEIEGLGYVNIMKISSISHFWQNIDSHYANKLLQKEFI